MQKFLNKVSWGVVAGASGILAFYLTAGVFGIRFIFAQVNGQTGQVATIFDTWWQTLIFALDIVFLVIFAASLALFILKKLKSRKAEGDK